MFYISAVSTDYNQIPTGNRDEDFESFVNEHDLEIVERNETTATVRAEWGNGEGYDEYEVTFESTSRDFDPEYWGISDDEIFEAYESVDKLYHAANDVYPTTIESVRKWWDNHTNE